MHVFQFAFIASGVCFAIFEHQSLLLYFFVVVIAYVGISHIIPSARDISTRQKIMLSTWTPPSEGIITARVPVRTEKCEMLIVGSDKKVTMTHFMIKATGQILREGRKMMGKLAFGKFVPYETCDISCLVDIEGGSDLAMILVEDVENLSVEDIAQIIREKGQKIKSQKGDRDHKERTKLANLFPAFVVTILISVVSFISCKLGISIPALAIKKNQFGAACVTSIGSFNFVDTVVPFSGFMNYMVLLAACKVTEEPVVEDGKVVIGRQIICNFSVDHRYMDGGGAKNFVKAFKNVFENPEKFLRSASGKG